MNADKMQSSEASDNILIRPAGGPPVRALVDEFHDLIGTDPAYRGIRAPRRSKTADVTISLAGWVCAWLRGRERWSDHPHTSLRRFPASLLIHADFPALRLEAIRRALERSARQEAELNQRLTRIAAAMAAR
ncbi:hypothetical protein [Mesorhizobium escarrei]|uniref:Globin n=1 Tax=Mesorhizobium escarrei TaxID=666018 RepID=A0ABM9DPZ6_9HYPH|nr:hypothetical protein [Mesorhizobium escarrei]CAH2398221.1 Putative Globin [Mesorhizobium escarrei]